MGYTSKKSDEEGQTQTFGNRSTTRLGEKQSRNDDRDPSLVPVSVVEQRASNLAQGTLCLVLLSGPFLHLLHHIPRGVLAGLL